MTADLASIVYRGGYSPDEVIATLADFENGAYEHIADIPPGSHGAFMERLTGEKWNGANGESADEKTAAPDEGDAATNLEMPYHSKYSTSHEQPAPPPELAYFPVQNRAKFPPLVPGWKTAATNDAQTIEGWRTVYGPDTNWGVHCKDLLVLDIDTHKGGVIPDGLPETYTVSTPSGGYHLYFRCPGGVPNSVGKIAAGVDVRSNGGYVLAAESVVDGKPYFVVNDVPIADAPQWLVDQCKAAKVTPVTTEEIENPNWDVDRALREATQWLASQEPAVEGAGGDMRTFQVCCHLRDLGVPRADMQEVLEPWNMQCSPPWEPDELQRKIENAFAYAQNAPGSKNVQAMFSPVEEEPDTAGSAAGGVASKNPEGKAPPTLFRRVRSLAEIKPGPELWQGAVPERALFAIGALPGRSKSYAAAGLCYALASDAGEFLGRALPKGFAAVYVDVERLSTTELRIAHWCQQDGIEAASLPLALGSGAFRIDDQIRVDALIAELRTMRDALGRDIGLVMLDSLGAALPGAELNSSGPATKTGDMLRRIRDSLGCAVGVVAHSPKSGVETVAGSLHFDAIFDTALFMRSENLGANGALYVKKTNALVVEERERFIPWTAETCSTEIDGRTIKVHRLRADSRRNDSDEMRTLVIIKKLMDDHKQVKRQGPRGLFQALCEAGIVTEDNTGRKKAGRIYESLAAKNCLEVTRATITLKERGAVELFDPVLEYESPLPGDDQ